MAIILNIDTALENASICLSENDKVLLLAKNSEQKDHAAWIHTAIQQIIKEAGLTLNNLDAIAVSAGPGSYTGLRVGMSTAKGLCYALNKPLITIGTLNIMAKAALADNIFLQMPASLLAPMIDARRLEVYTALLTQQLNEVLSPHPLILAETAYNTHLEGGPIIFFGNGSIKFKNMTSHPHAFFIDCPHSAENMVELSLNSFIKRNFANLAYAEPMYVKAFYTPPL